MTQGPQPTGAPAGQPALADWPPPDTPGSPRPPSVLAEAFAQCRPELAGLVKQGVEQWPKRVWLMASWAAVLGSSDPRHVLFAAGPGFGKTVAAAQFGLAAVDEGWTVVGVFFRHGWASLEDPLGVVEHLSAQLARVLPGFSEAREASRMESGAGNPIQVQIGGGINVTAAHVSGKVVGAQVTPPSGRPVDRAWRCDIADPLAALHRSRSLPPVLIVADALDETSAATRGLLADGLTMLPEPVRVLMTARPGTRLPVGDPATARTVAQLQPDPAPPDAGHDAAQQDASMIAAWAGARLNAAGSDRTWSQHVGRRIATAADRTFLVAAYLTDDLVRRLKAGEQMPPADEVDLPTGGLAGIYDAFLARIFGEDATRWRTLGRPVLGCLSVARGSGLTAAMISAATELDLTEVTDTLTDMQAFVSAGPGASGVTIWRIWHRSFADHLHASATYRVRPWDWQLRLGAALLAFALHARASTVLDADHRQRYATANAVHHLIDATADPEGVASDPARTALSGLDDGGGWLEALVLLAGPSEAAAQVERLATVGPPGVPWRAAADAIRQQAHTLHAPLILTDGFTLGQLSLEAARSADAVLTAVLGRWSDLAPMLLARWSTAVSAGDVVMTHPAGITEMAATDVAHAALCLIGGSDGWVRAWSPRTGRSAGAWRVPTAQMITSLACVGEGATRAAGATGGDAEDRGEDGSALVAVGTPTATYALRWGVDGSVSALWQSEDGFVTAALALDLGADAGPLTGGHLLVTSHGEELLVRDLVTGQRAGNPPSLPMPVFALASIMVQGGDCGLPRQAVLAASISDSGRSIVWDPRTDRLIGELSFGDPVSCLAQAPGEVPGPLAVGVLGGRVKVGRLGASEGALEFEPWAQRPVGRSRKASAENVGAVAWTSDGSRPYLLVGDSAGRIHRFDPASMTRGGLPWMPGHASSVVALIALPGNADGDFLSAGSDGFVRIWAPADIDPATWPDQVLALDVADPPAGPAAIVCAHATGELSQRRLDNGDLIHRAHVHESPVWALAWAGPALGMVSGDSQGIVVASRWQSPGSDDGGGHWCTGELARLSGQLTCLSSGLFEGQQVVLASTLFSELAMLDASGSCRQYAPFGGIPLTTRLAVTSAGPCLIIEREVTADHSRITGEPRGRQLHVISPLPPPGADSLRPTWRLWWEDPEMLGGWDVAAASSPLGDTSAQEPGLLVAGLRDGAVLTFDLERVVANPNLDLDHYQIHEAWPGRSSVATITAGVVDGRLVTAWTTDDGWLFVEHSWQQPPLRMQLGTRVLVARIAPDGTILLGGIDGVTAVRLR